MPSTTKRSTRYVDLGCSVPRSAVTVRMPRSLQRLITTRAFELGVPVNDYMLACIKQGLASKNK